MGLAETFLTQRLPSLVFKINGGGIKKYEVEPVEQKAVVQEHGLFHSILGAAGRK
jgi:hypothetical protein